ncbi:unnamed protein product [Mesocestoides corti]|uniref:Dynactin domain-containing protein n=1 Tax=Mesocestoides corti TaxID=53468 RepID=A0A0R3U6R6_MESCO|nr:unnamed protein product [Mesocestoides corti]
MSAKPPTSEEQLLQQIEKLQVIARLLTFRACRSEEINKKSDLAVKKMQQNKVQLKQQSQMVVDDLEQVIFAILTSLKSFQAEARATLFGLQTQLQTSERQLLEANETIGKLTEKVEGLENALAENRRIFEINLQAIHITYVNCMEKVFGRLQSAILSDLDDLIPINDTLHEAYSNKFKSLNLPCSFENI